MSSVLAAAAPSSSLVVRREKRRRRANVSGASSSAKRPRRGFVFSEPPAGDAWRGDGSDREDEWRPSRVPSPPVVVPSAAPAFSYRAKRGGAGGIPEAAPAGKKLDVDAAERALREARERAEKQEQRRLRQQRKKEEVEREAALEEEVKRVLSADQAALYHIVHAQVRRELRKTKKQFATSSGRHDVISLTEKSFHALKRELITYMRDDPPNNLTVKLPNPENARLRALIDTYEKQISRLNEEEQQWLELKSRVEAETDAATEKSRDSSHQQQPSVECELKVTQSVEELQRAVIKRFGSTTRQLDLLEASMSTIDQLIVEAESRKATLFGAFHDSAFKGYANMTQPKENLRALLRHAPAP